MLASHSDDLQCQHVNTAVSMTSVELCLRNKSRALDQRSFKSSQRKDAICTRLSILSSSSPRRSREPPTAAAPHVPGGPVCLYGPTLFLAQANYSTCVALQLSINQKHVKKNQLLQGKDRIHVSREGASKPKLTKINA